jgi:hypothetical protein
MKTIKLFTVAALALIGCGDNRGAPDARVRDSSGPDAFVIPAVPTIGAQIDRMGRAAVNTALNHGFDPSAAADTAKVAYNQMTAKTDWLGQANVGEFMKNLAFIDVLDSGICGNGICETGETGTAAGNCMVDCGTTATGAGNGCGNQVLFNGNPAGGGTATPLSYATLAGILAEDELYLDTGKTNCSFYLGVEFGVVTGGGNSTCGGRTPEYDVIDFSFSMLAMGLKGFSNTFQPQITDGVPKHADVSSTDFPFLGTPH